MRGASFQADRQDFGVLLNLAFGAFKRQLHAHLADAGFDDLGPSFGYVLRMLEADKLNLTQVSEGLAITPQGALKIVADMVAKGYVARVDDVEDARVKRLELTPRSRALLREAKKFHARFETEIATASGQHAAAAARKALEAVVRQANEKAPVRLQPL